MKLIDLYLIFIITLILRLVIKDNVLFFLSGIPVGVILGILRARSNYAESQKKKDDKNV